MDTFEQYDANTLTAAARASAGPCPRSAVKLAVVSSPWSRPASFLMLGIWFGLLTGLTEMGCLTVCRHLEIVPLFVLSTHYVWMVPLADVSLFAVAGLIFSPLACLRREALWLRVAAMCFGLFYFLMLLAYLSDLLSLGLHPLAALLLAAGLSVQAAYLLAARPRAFHTLCRRTSVAMALFVALLAGALCGWRWSDERRMLASLPPASPDAPNVLLIVLDTVRAKSLSLYGYGRSTTPHLERLARKGALFEKAVATAPWTLPSHASMFTGRYPHEMTAGWATPLSAAQPTLAEALRSRGYLTAGFVANAGYCGRQTGLNRGFVHYEDCLISPGGVFSNSWLARQTCLSNSFRRWFGFYDNLGRKNAARVNHEFLRWLTQQQRRPFFVFLNYLDAHSPYLPGQPFDHKYGPQTTEEELLMTRWDFGFFVANRRQVKSPREIALALDAYDGCIAYLDHQLGLLLDELGRRGQLDDTLLIVTSDHGEQFGEHGLFVHGNSLYRPLLHVPLLVVFPGRVPAGERVRELVSLRNLSATILDLVGHNDGRFPGSSLASYWGEPPRVEQQVSEPALAEVAWMPGWVTEPIKALWMEGRQYIKRYDTGEEELYDFENDWLEQYNLAESEVAHPELRRFRRVLAEILNAQGQAPGSDRSDYAVRVSETELQVVLPQRSTGVDTTMFHNGPVGPLGRR